MGSADDNLYALTETHERLAEVEISTTGAIHSSPRRSATDGTIYVGSEDDNLYALTDTARAAR